VHLLLVRHGESYVNVDGWDQGYIDTGLTKLGQRQAESLAAWMAQHARIDALYTSTMARALETTAYLTQATGLTAIRDDRLREFGNCYADGTAVPPEAMPIVYAEFWGTERPYTPIDDKGGESWILFRLRVGRFLDELIETYGNGHKQEGAGNPDVDPETTVVIVCHGGVIDATFDYVFNVGPLQRPVEVWTHNTGIVHWEYSPDSGREPWRLHAHGMGHHLLTCDGEWLGSKPMMRDATRKTVAVKGK
jgi:broad specificity phosphatase PhoE